VDRRFSARRSRRDHHFAFLAAAASLRSLSDSRFCPGAAGMESGARLPVSFPFGVPAAGADCSAARLRLGNALVAEAILFSRLVGVLQIAAKASMACRASVAVTVPDADPARSIRTEIPPSHLRAPRCYRSLSRSTFHWNQHSGASVGQSTAALDPTQARTHVAACWRKLTLCLSPVGSPRPPACQSGPATRSETNSAGSAKPPRPVSFGHHHPCHH
jgi:hypothetical protein